MIVFAVWAIVAVGVLIGFVVRTVQEQPFSDAADAAGCLILGFIFGVLWPVYAVLFALYFVVAWPVYWLGRKR